LLKEKAISKARVSKSKRVPTIIRRDTDWLCSEEFSDEEFSDEPDSDEDLGEERMEIPPEERQAAMDKLVAPLDQGDYGKMPATYSQSQRVKPTTIETDIVKEEGLTDEKSSHNVTSGRPKSPQRIRPPIFPRNQYDGADSDDETDEEGMDDDDDDERPQVVGDIEIDMDEEEEEFLEFSRQALGISDAQWNDIIKDRQDRGGE